MMVCNGWMNLRDFDQPEKKSHTPEQLITTTTTLQKSASEWFNNIHLSDNRHMPLSCNNNYD